MSNLNNKAVELASNIMLNQFYNDLDSKEKSLEIIKHYTKVTGSMPAINIKSEEWTRVYDKRMYSISLPKYGATEFNSTRDITIGIPEKEYNTIPQRVPLLGDTLAKIRWGFASNKWVSAIDTKMGLCIGDIVYITYRIHFSRWTHEGKEFTKPELKQYMQEFETIVKEEGFTIK